VFLFLLLSLSPCFPSSHSLLSIPHIALDDDDEDETDGMEERMKKKCAAEDEKERVNAVLSGLGEVLEEVKGVSGVTGTIMRGRKGETID
jgi:hypothetical protein